MTTLRMKNRKMAGLKLALTIQQSCQLLESSGTLYEELDKVFNGTVSEEMLEEMIEIVQLSAAQANKKSKKSNIYPMRRAPMPYEGQPLTANRKAIKNLVKNRIVSDLNFIY